MLKIRLSRTGKKSQPSFRIVVQEHTAAVKGGKVVEMIGYYRPATAEKEFKVDLERIKYWLSVGAKPSDSLAALLKKEGVDGMDQYMEPRDKKRKKKKEQSEAEAPSGSAADAPTKEEATGDEKDGGAGAPESAEPTEEKPADEPAPAEDKLAEEEKPEEPKES